MNQSSKKVLHYLTGNESIEAVTTEDLQKMVAESPYFPISQLLLAKKLKSENEEQYLLQAQKTALYFSNPYWLNYQLNEDDFDKELLDPDWATTLTEETQADVLEESTNNLISSSSEIPEAEQDPDQIAEIAENAPSEEKTIETETERKTIDNREINSERIELPDVVQEQEEGATITSITSEESDDFTLPVDTTTTASTQINLSDLPPAVEKEVIELEEEMAGVTHLSDDITEKFLEEAENKPQKDELQQDDEHDLMFRNIKAMLDASTEEADAETQDAFIPLDPYYTIDYFASQGIKLELDQNPQDQLGQNLKKFTQWLKHMKKLGPEDATEVITRTESETDIQKIADSSNTVREVVTEAMALVLEKQGKKDKAIELYNKLSFLNPDKRTYFADKIKKLKGS